MAEDTEEQDGPVADEQRSYTQKEVDALGAKGQAFKNPDGSYSYPVATVQDLRNAIHAVGRGNADHDAIRKYIMARAKALGESSLIPDNWNADGSLQQQNAADRDPELELRRVFAESMKGSREVREFTVDGMECRSLDDGTLRMSGYASLTEDPYQIGSEDRGFQETIARGAFKRTIGEPGTDVVLLVNHDGIPLAGTRNSSLALHEDSRGLRWTADLDPDDPDSQMLARKVGTGLLDQCSMAFVATGEKWSDDFKQRRITAVSLHRGDVSVVTHGANANTTVGLRAMIDDLEERAGKTLSATSRAEIQAARDKLDELLKGSDSKPDPDQTPDTDGEDLDGRSAVDAGAEVKAAAEKVLTGRKLELDFAFERRRQQMELLKRKAGSR